jgi:hypothetical protein
MSKQLQIILLIAAVLVIGIAASNFSIKTVEKSSTTVWLLGNESECLVTTQVANQRKWLPCSDVPRHLRGTLHLPVGDSVAIAAPPNAPKESVRFMSGQLKQWGYTVSGVFPTMTFKDAPQP